MNQHLKKKKKNKHNINFNRQEENNFQKKLNKDYMALKILAKLYKKLYIK